MLKYENTFLIYYQVSVRESARAVHNLELLYVADTQHHEIGTLLSLTYFIETISYQMNSVIWWEMAHIIGQSGMIWALKLYISTSASRSFFSLCVPARFYQDSISLDNKAYEPFIPEINGCNQCTKDKSSAGATTRKNTRRREGGRGKRPRGDHVVG